jgi:TonB family protein
MSSAKKAKADFQAALAQMDPGETDQPPTVVHAEFPSYPLEARATRSAGVVTVQFTVDEQGSVCDPVILSSPDPLLSEASLRAIRTWKFMPRTKDGSPTKVTCLQRFAFQPMR